LCGCRTDPDLNGSGAASAAFAISIEFSALGAEFGLLMAGNRARKSRTRPHPGFRDRELLLRCPDDRDALHELLGAIADQPGEERGKL
jgi:hypothetical protein